MKRFHLHVGVSNLEESVQFYSTLFGEPPTKLKTDYAKWMLEDPKVNFAISTRVQKNGIDHLGIQVDDLSELKDITERLKKADLKIFGEGEITCCYAKSSKAWVKDPSGVPWETYQSMGEAEVFSQKPESEQSQAIPSISSTKAGCC